MLKRGDFDLPSHLTFLHPNHSFIMKVHRGEKSSSAWTVEAEKKGKETNEKMKIYAHNVQQTYRILPLHGIHGYLALP